MPTNDELQSLAPGGVYAVRLNDCCIEGELYGIFIGWTPSDEAVFDFGILDPDWGQWHPKLIDKAEHEQKLIELYKMEVRDAYGETSDRD